MNKAMIKKTFGEVTRVPFLISGSSKAKSVWSIITASS